MRGQRGERSDRREKVADYWLKGYSNKEIAEATGYSLQEVGKHLTKIKSDLSSKGARKLEYRKNRLIAKLGLAQKKAWDIWTKSTNDTMKLSAHRVLTGLLELEAKVEGVIAEKTPTGADRAVESLFKELLSVEKRAKGDGHQEVEETMTDAK